MISPHRWWIPGRRIGECLSIGPVSFTPHENARPLSHTHSQARRACTRTSHSSISGQEVYTREHFHHIEGAFSRRVRPVITARYFSRHGRISIKYMLVTYAANEWSGKIDMRAGSAGYNYGLPPHRSASQDGLHIRNLKVPMLDSHSNTGCIDRQAWFYRYRFIGLLSAADRARMRKALINTTCADKHWLYMS